MSQSLCKPVVCVETGIIYNSITDAFNRTNTNIGGISVCCRNHQKTANGFHWCFLNDYQGKRAFFNEIKQDKEVGRNGKRPMGKHTMVKCIT